MIIEGTNVRLRQPGDSDLSVLIELRNDQELQRLLLADWKPNSADDVRAWLKRRTGDINTFFAVIADQLTDQCSGFIQILGMKPPHHNGSLGIALHPSARGRGYGAEAIRLSIQHAINTNKLRKVVLHVMSGNEAAVGLYRKLGFRIVGTMQDHYWNGSNFEDVHVMEQLVSADDAAIHSDLNAAAATTSAAGNAA